MFLVAGATTPIGSHVAQSLVARGRHIRATLDDPDNAGSLFHPNIQLVAPGPDAFKGVEAAALVGNPGQARQWAAEAREAGVRHAVFLGAIADAPSDEAHAALEVGVDCVTYVRAMPSMAELLDAAPVVAQEHVLRLPIGGSSVAYVDPRDVGDLIVASLLGMGDPCGEYTATGPESLTGETIAGHIGDVIGHPIAYKPAKGPDDELAAQLAGTTLDIEYVLGRAPRGVEQYLARHAGAFKPKYASTPLDAPPKARTRGSRLKPPLVQGAGFEPANH